MISITRSAKKHHRYAKVNIYDDFSLISDSFSKVNDENHESNDENYHLRGKKTRIRISVGRISP